MLSSETLAAIDKEIAKYPPEQRRSAVMSALRLAQVEKGWLSDETMAFVAQYLDMPPIAVREVATFYNMYELAPVGKYKITVCTNLSCTLTGALDIVEHLKKRLNIEVGQTTADGKFTLRAAECMGACGDAPLCTINNHRMEGFLTPEKLDRLLSELE
ncbi:MAG: NADH-quinone oxidoreductase subunit NuoE [Betaproteobacteria bacterium]|nr:NADH-quinone oxidoreductase subunit NuoE [Betaproteobacteria bacterium]